MKSSLRRFLLPLAVIAVAVVGLAACGSDSGSTDTSTDNSSTSSSSAPADSPAVKTADVPGVGAVLVDPEGKVVYTFTNNGATVDCTGGCLAAWPAVLLPAGTDTATGASDLTVVTTSAGKQVASKGLPLYTFSGDSGPGVANGEGLASFGGTWRVVKVDAAGASGATDSSSTTTDTTDDSDDGY